ncbi:MAG: ribonuclease HI [Candidatus Caccovivens sp.]
MEDSACVVLYTDGACSGNPGAGGWASILSYKGKEKVLSGGEEMTTNNRMELMAVIMGLESVKEGSVVKVHSDSAYVVNAFNQGWLENWKRAGWKTSSKSDVLNKDLWQRLVSVVENLQVEFVKVKGHSDNALNNRCDELARAEIAKLGG